MDHARQKFASVDEYIASFPEDVQVILKKIREEISSIIPEADQVISYGIPTFKINGKYLIYFAGFQKHVSIYPANDELEKAVKDVSKYRVSKGTMQFKLSEPIPYDLIREVVSFKLSKMK
jgi:uncharacterized protein YdhG (YjbR/CyaY superfamily)